MTESSAIERRTGFLAILDRWTPAIVTVGAVVGGYWLLVDTMLDGIKENIAALRTETGQRIDGREAEDRDIRGVIEKSNEAVRMEIGKLGDRLVAVNETLVAQIDKMRGEIVGTMKEGDARLERRFDRLDEKFDTLLSKIDYDVIEIPWNQGFIVEADGKLVDQGGKVFGVLPAVIRVSKP